MAVHMPLTNNQSSLDWDEDGEHGWQDDVRKIVSGLKS